MVVNIINIRSDAIIVIDFFYRVYRVIRTNDHRNDEIDKERFDGDYEIRYTARSR